MSVEPAHDFDALAGRSLVRAETIKARRVEWLWRQHVPVGMLTVLASRPGVGKSLLACHVVADVTRRGSTAILSNHEDVPAKVIRPRLDAAGAVLREVFLPREPARLPDELDVIEGQLARTGARLLVLDTATQHLTTAVTNDQAVRRALTPLAKVLERLGCACLMLHHVTKGNPSHPLDAIGGSGGGLAAAARMVHVLGYHPDDPDGRVLAPAKSNVGARPPSLAFLLDADPVPRLVPQGRTRIGTAAVLAASAPAVVHPAKVALAAEWLTRYLALGARPRREIREDGVARGLSWHAIAAAADEIGVDDSDGRWALPAGHPAADGQGVDTEDGA